jgi:hypothetical protein
MAVVFELHAYSPSLFGPALIEPAGTDGARGRQAVTGPVSAAMCGLHTQEKVLMQEKVLIPQIYGSQRTKRPMFLTDQGGDI